MLFRAEQSRAIGIVHTRFGKASSAGSFEESVLSNATELAIGVTSAGARAPEGPSSRDIDSTPEYLGILYRPRRDGEARRRAWVPLIRPVARPPPKS